MNVGALFVGHDIERMPLLKRRALLDAIRETWKLDLTSPDVATVCDETSIMAFPTRTGGRRRRM